MTWLAIVKLSASTARSRTAPVEAFLNTADVAVTLPELHRTSDLSVVLPTLNAVLPWVARMSWPHAATASLTLTFVSVTPDTSLYCWKLSAPLPIVPVTVTPDSDTVPSGPYPGRLANMMP